ncbi:hypothetical protein JVT61DRAFT_841 [Boletus reticuloceps]|uniref:PH domain-containing protein n=1 Tax=Boletus reticuloceps TaxID=495285 RepID=A0A8I3AH47_9AGAM|nr:hypothetical protein JVT61DRAFT_841 [Boletus reticuloceps]
MKPLPVLTDHTMSASSDHIHYPPSTLPPPQVPPKVAFQPRVTPTPRVRRSPEERLKRQLSAQRRLEREEQDALREEQECQTRRLREKAESEQRAREEEERKRAILQDHIQHAAARRAREEREAQAAEEHRLHEINERKQLEHERRLQYTRELQKWRHEHIRRAESQSSEKEEERKRSAEARRSRIQRIGDAVLQDGSPEASNGWVTIQTPDNLAWKRRYFMFDLAHAQLTLCRSQRDSTRSIDLINLDGRIESFHEWHEGFEELEAIPHSFAVKFVGGSAWLMFADSEEDKDRLLILLSEAAGVIL